MNPGIEAGALNRVIQTNNQSYVTFDSLTIRDGNALGDNVVNVGSSSVIGIVFQNCTIERGVADGIDFKGSTTATSVTINNCTIQNNGNWGVWVDDAYTSGTISNNAIHGNGWNSITNNNEYSGIEGNNLSNFHIYGNTIYDQAPKGCKTGGSLGDFCHGIYVPASTVATNIYNNIIRDNAYGDGVKLRGSANVYKNKIYNNAGSGIECGGNGTANVIYSIYQNLIFENNTNNQGDGIVEQLIGTGTISLIVENNTVYQNGNISQQEFNVADNVTILTVKNNLFYATPTRKTMASLAQTGTVSIDYNLHWRADGDPNLFYAGVGKTWAQWQALGYDTHGFNANPLFVNASGNNFQLQSTSPAIKAGTNVGLTTDFLGKPIIGLPDLGVYEWDPLLSPPLNLQIVPN
jgi:parallel beta-helix repeat protein